MRLILLTVLLSLLALTWWGLESDGSSADRAELGEEQVIDYFVEELELTTYGAEGAPLRHLQAEQLIHRRNSGQTLLSRPRFTLFRNGEALWHIASDSGVLTEDQSRLMLKGQVKIRRLPDPETAPLHIVTRNLLVEPQREYAETAEAVTITSNGNRIEAVGMQAWLRPPGRIKFLSQTRARYAASETQPEYFTGRTML